jgi:uncharacterized protein
VKLRIHNQSKGTTLATCADIAETPAAKQTGLLDRNALKLGEGLWLTNCNSIHTVGMSFPIDVLFLDAEGKVLAMLPSFAPGHKTVPFNWPSTRSSTAESWPGKDLVQSVLELPAGVARANRTNAGDQLSFERY